MNTKELIKPTVEIDQRKTRGELAVELIKAFRLYIALALAGGITALWWFQPTMPDLPVPVEVALLAGIGAFALGYVPAWGLLNYLHDPPKRFIVSIGLTQIPDKYDDLPADAWRPGIYKLTPAAWEQVTVLEDDIYQWDDMKWPTYEVLAFDPDSLEAVGTWRGSKPDTELLRREKEIDDIRQNLEQAADHSIDLEISISSKVRQAVREIGQSIITEHASASTYNGEKVAEVLSEIREEIEQDAGQGKPTKNGEKPVRELRTLTALSEAEGDNG